MIQITEYARITPHKCEPSLSIATVSQSTFDWLIDLKQQWGKDDSIMELENKNCLRLGSYVGYLQSPSGEGIEVLPKIYDGSDPDRLRNILKKMLECLFNVKGRDAGPAQLNHIHLPLHEWIFQSFISELATLMRKGLKLDYIYVEEECKFIRGRLDIIKQLRQSPDRQTNFNIRYDVYSINRLENRLLKSALRCILKLSKNPDNRRRAMEYSHILHDIEPYQDAAKHLVSWSNARDMHIYQYIRPWCEIILNHLNPFFHQGKYHGIALLFPMEKVFEAYVTHHLKKTTPRIQSQAGFRYLTTHENKNYFQLKPDLFFAEARQVIDIKWKQIFMDRANYGISREDMRQMFAYGHKYIDGEGNMMLIYPKHNGFFKPLGCFLFDKENKLNLWAIPFDLEDDRLVGDNECHSVFWIIFGGSIVNDKLLGGLWGLLIGDAIGVSYEFKASSSIPPYEEIEMVPPVGYHKTYSHIPPGTWSDDGAQALCLLASLMECNGLDLRNFADKLLLWADKGLYAVDNVVFDIGNQTARALSAYRHGASPEESGNIPNGKGNGALMRVLPAVVWCKLNGKYNSELINIAHKQCLVTHGHLTNQICCALYCITSRNLLSMDFDNAYAAAYTELEGYYQSAPDYLDELHQYFSLDMDFRGTGSGYVVDSLHSAFMILKRAVSYEDAVKQAVALGDDTDTTACITGGAAGILFGYSNIPSRWLEQLRGKEIISHFVFI